MDTTPPPTALTPLRPDPAAPAGGRALSQGLASDPAIATRGLTKTFGTGRKARTVVADLDLAVPRGVVYGFLGPNGSGKSTTMKMLLGLLAPTRGDVALLGTPLDRRSRGPLMARTGSMIERPPGYTHLTGAENMRIIQRMLGLTDRQVERALDLVRLSEHKDRLVRAYSLGMKQRLGIAMALAREPELLVLDEPTNGLDPAGIEEVRHLLIDLAGQGVSVMVSSHLLDEIDRMASVLGILSAGRLVFQGTRSDLMRRSVPDLHLVSPSADAVGPALLTGIVPSGAEARSLRRVPDGLQIAGLSADAAAELARRLVAAGVPIHELRRQTQNLEDVFRDLTGGTGVL